MVLDGSSLVIVLGLLLLALCQGVPDTPVSCVYRSVCVLPCTFQTADELVIHWQQLDPARKRMVHSYHSGEDQFSNQDSSFRDRTSLFHDQITHGNASLALMEVRIQDEGRYQCYTSNTKGNKESFDVVTVKAPVVSVTMELVGDAVRCTSRGIYPQPTLSWSTSPPTTLIFHNLTTVNRNADKLYDISSTLAVLVNDTRFAYICSVIGTDGEGKTITLRQLPTVVVGHGSDDVTIPCQAPNLALEDFSVTWRFNHNDTILSFHSTVPGTLVTEEEWMERVKGVSDLGVLELRVKLEGVYICELSHAEDTYVSYTYLKNEINQQEPHTGGVSVGAIVGGTVAAAVFIIIIAIAIYISCKKKSSDPEPATKDDEEMDALQKT